MGGVRPRSSWLISSLPNEHPETQGANAQRKSQCRANVCGSRVLSSTSCYVMLFPSRQNSPSCDSQSKEGRGEVQEGGNIDPSRPSL
jgi:hypothetical protein